MKSKHEIDAMLFVRNDYVVDPSHPHLGGNHYNSKTTFWPELGLYLIEKFHPRSVLDVGCGQGRAMQYFWERLAPGSAVIGIDGLPWNAHTCSLPVLVHDLTKGPALFSNIHLVWCVELVEHIEERYIDNVLQTLANGDIICMTHGLPKQGGYHHVNLQPSSYWVTRLRGMHYELDQRATRESRAKVPKGSHWDESGMIFKKVS